MPEFSEKNKKDPDKLRYRNLFLAGCGVGNRVAMLPLNKDEVDITMLKQFTDTLLNINLNPSQITPVMEVKKVLESDHGKIDSKRKMYLIEDFLKTMNKIPDYVQQVSEPQENDWFQFGHYMYDIVTTIIFGNKDCTEVEDKLNTIKQISQKILDDSDLQNKVDEFIDNIRDKKSSIKIMNNCNDIANKVSEYLLT